jgi:hypothetical protein
MPLTRWFRQAASWGQPAWAVLGCRLLTFFAIQGVVVLAAYAWVGPTLQSDDLPAGLQLDARHAAVHLALGLAGGYVGFAQPSLAVRYVQFFGLTYLFLAVFGTFTTTHFGMELGFNENALHWSLGSLAAVVGFGPTLLRHRRRSRVWR